MMTEDQVRSLRRGDMVRHGSGDSLLIIQGARKGRPAVAIRTVEVCNPIEWTLLSRGYDSQAEGAESFAAALRAEIPDLDAAFAEEVEQWDL